MRKYHQYRDQARGMTTALCVLLAVAAVGTIVLSALALAGVAVASTYSYLAVTTNVRMPAEHWRGMFFQRLFEAGGLTVLMVAGMALYKSFQLAEGGGDWVARSLGGTRVLGDTADAAQRRLFNVVEELTIATGLRTPHVYVLADEPGINAFAAGWDEKEAVIGVTQGAIECLKRHQLQGVVAHEFSHIANGDIRLNVRLLGVLAGIQVISFVAGYLIRLGTALAPNSQLGGRHGKHPLGMVLAVAFGIVIWPIGQIGSLFARLINLAVNRQREFLADASAVQYTRDPQGLREALQILQSHEGGPRLRGPEAQLASHMFFAGDGNAWQRLFHTHPELKERIRRLDSAIGAAGDPDPEKRPLPRAVSQREIGDTAPITAEEVSSIVVVATLVDRLSHN